MVMKSRTVLISQYSQSKIDQNRPDYPLRRQKAKGLEESRRRSEEEKSNNSEGGN
jgi:UDP-galactopyranose mutase